MVSTLHRLYAGTVVTIMTFSLLLLGVTGVYAQTNVFSITQPASILTSGTTTLNVTVSVGDAGAFSFAGCPTHTTASATASSGTNTLAFTGLSNNDIYSQCAVTFNPSTSGLSDNTGYIVPFGVAVTYAQINANVGSTTVNSIFSAFGSFVGSNAALIITVAIFGALIAVAWNKLGFGRR